MAPLRSVLTNVCMYHGKVSYGRYICVSLTTLTDLTFTDSSLTNDAFTRAHLIQNKVKNCVMNGWLAIILAVMPVAVMQLTVIILAVMQLADIKLADMQLADIKLAVMQFVVIKLAVMQLAVIELAVIGWNHRHSPVDKADTNYNLRLSLTCL